MARVQIKLPNDFIDALDSASSLIDNVINEAAG